MCEGGQAAAHQVGCFAVSKSPHKHQEVTMPQLNSSLKYFTRLLCWVPFIKQSVSESSFFFFSFFLLPRAAKSHNFIMPRGLVLSLLRERLVCLARGPNYLPCRALISVVKRRENNLYDSSSRLEAEPQD